ncbi:hypothetical protein H1D32_14095 [Anaerobacillus sp. CMMVII]|uniref:BsuPI-related putative proteinase inhibitor n=1 Tax=Anaerobacillus sp. CMMVII TaxID=2755588 RepID=UPI0021B71939|nr:BsuPI-related putative proteinase inhibitor [Anaerobacillus sp. CMMVII]MCT8138767.1 hypothetical protein [Anaerobacillus sp. CMMVII]
MKKVINVLVILFVCSLVTFALNGCSLSGEAMNKTNLPGEFDFPQKNEENFPKGIIAGAIESTLTEAKTSNTNDNTLSFLYSLINQTGNEVSFSFTSELMFDYQLLNATSDIISHYSEDQNSLKEKRSVFMIQGESLQTEINFHGLEKGTYTLEVWLVDQDEDYKKSIFFTVN